MANEPIIPQNFCFGPNVVDIGDIRVARGLTRRPASSCKHRQMNYDPKERRIWCADCETDIDPFDAFEFIVERLDGARKDLQRRFEEVKAAEEHSLISIAAKTMDREWRRKNMVPCCPLCGGALLPEDFKKPPRSMSRDYALAKRLADAKRKKERSDDE